MKVTLINWSTKEELNFSCISWSIENYQHIFYQDKDGKIVESCYSCRYWDIRHIDYL